jgi:serine/threonine-protein kinase
MQMQSGELDGAEESLGQALELQRARLGGEHPQVAVTLTKLANLNQTRARLPEARARRREALEIRRAPEATPRDLHLALYAFGVFLSKTGACDEALAPLEEALAGLRAASPPDPLTEGYAALALGGCLATLGRSDEARLQLREAVRCLELAPGARPEQLEAARTRLRALDAPERSPGEPVPSAGD